MRIVHAQEQFPTDQRWRHRHRRGPCRHRSANPLGNPLAFGGFSLAGSLVARFLGPVPAADRGGARPIAGASLGATRGAACRLWNMGGIQCLHRRSARARPAVPEIAREHRGKTSAGIGWNWTSRLEHGGLRSAIGPCVQAEELLYTAAAQVPQIEQEIQQQENAVRLLLGQTPGTVPHTAANALAAPPPDLPAGLPSQLLERRPDIQQSEQRTGLAPTLRSAWHGRSSFHRSPLARPPAWVATNSRTSSISRARRFTASGR